MHKPPPQTSQKPHHVLNIQHQRLARLYLVPSSPSRAAAERRFDRRNEQPVVASVVNRQRRQRRPQQPQRIIDKLNRRRNLVDLRNDVNGGHEIDGNRANRSRADKSHRRLHAFGPARPLWPLARIRIVIVNRLILRRWPETKGRPAPSSFARRLQNREATPCFDSKFAAQKYIRVFARNYPCESSRADSHLRLVIPNFLPALRGFSCQLSYSLLNCGAMRLLPASAVMPPIFQPAKWPLCFPSISATARTPCAAWPRP